MPRPITCCICETHLGEISGKIRKDTFQICGKCLGNIGKIPIDPFKKRGIVHMPINNHIIVVGDQFRIKGEKFESQWVDVDEKCPFVGANSATFTKFEFRRTIRKAPISSIETVVDFVGRN